MAFMSSKGPKFYFSGQPVHRPHYIVFRRRGQPSQLIGYFFYVEVKWQRERKFQFRRHPHGGQNTACARLREKRVSKITPSEWTEDPYLVCILLSLAQLQERTLSSTSHTVRLFSLCLSDNLTNTFMQVTSSCGKPRGL